MQMMRAIAASVRTPDAPKLTFQHTKALNNQRSFRVKRPETSRASKQLKSNPLAGCIQWTVKHHGPDQSKACLC